MYVGEQAWDLHSGNIGEVLFLQTRCLAQCLFWYCAFSEKKGFRKFWSGGWGASKAKLFKRNCETKVEFLEGLGGSDQKTFCQRGMDVFCNSAFC